MSNRRLEFSARTLAAVLAHYPRPRRYVVAYSGGVDSSVLLHALVVLIRTASWQTAVDAVHVHHGLHPRADTWAEHCARECERLQIPLICQRVRVEQGAAGLEASARDARYQVLRAYMQHDDVLLTAHHADDQAETVLLHLTRGAGVRGLAGMAERRRFGAGWHQRPLLDVSRAALQGYAETHGLTWIEDPSNADVTLQRNFLRHQVIPLLNTRWPAAVAMLNRAARHLADAEQVLTILAGEHLSRCLTADGGLSVSALTAAERILQPLILRAWVAQFHIPPPPAQAIQRILDELVPAADDAEPLVAWPNVEVRRYRQTMYLLERHAAVDASQCWQWLGDAPLRLPNNGELRAELADQDGIALRHWQSSAVRVGYRRGGERLRLAGRSGSHAVKKLYQEAGVPPWLRARTPLVFIDGQLAAIPGRWIDARFAAPCGAPQLRIIWTPQPTSRDDSGGAAC